MSIQVKICGLNTADAARAAVSVGADYAGLVFFAKSPRAVSPQKAAPLADILRGVCKIVALTVRADDALLNRIVAQVHPDFLQLHGGESPARIAEVKARYGLPVIVAVPLSRPEDMAAAGLHIAVLEPSDRLLFDAKPPKDARLPGGNGIAFDWTMLEGQTFPCPWLLAGGLSVGNLAKAVRASGAKAVDVSSGVESAPGLKDPGKMAAFVDAARDL